jgi:hypothetical protein
MPKGYITSYYVVIISTYMHWFVGILSQRTLHVTVNNTAPAAANPRETGLYL